MMDKMVTSKLVRNSNSKYIDYIIFEKAGFKVLITVDSRLSDQKNASDIFRLTDYKKVG